jgi:hypothetical protein
LVEFVTLRRFAENCDAYISRRRPEGQGELFGERVNYRKVLITSARLSEYAKDEAKRLGIQCAENIRMPSEWRTKVFEPEIRFAKRAAVVELPEIERG